MKINVLIISCLVLLCATSALALGDGPDKPSTARSVLGNTGTSIYSKKFNWGISLYGGYSNIRGKYEDADSAESDCGYNFGLAADARYNISDRFAIVGRLRLVEYNGFADKDEQSLTVGPYSTVTETHSGLETHTLGIDFMADWNFLENTHLYGGLSITANYLTNTRAWGTTTQTYNGMTTTTDFGSKDWNEWEDINKTSIGLSIGVMHDFKVGPMYLSPYLESTIPFTNDLEDDFGNTTWGAKVLQIRGGVRFQFGE
jgi:hypothetical protein